MRLIFLGYFGYLTILLFSRNPMRWVEFPPNMASWVARLMPVAHLLSFLVLTILAAAAQWPLRWWALGAVLGGYAVATELLQGLTATRQTEWSDFFQNCAGIVIGLVASWLALLVFRSFHKATSSAKVQESL
jgi:hypothetical protein